MTFVNDVYETVKEASILDDTLFILMVDHGGTPFDGNGAGHGGWTDGEKYVTFAASGRGVQKGSVGDMNIRDLAAIVLYALGIERPALDEQVWTAQVPDGLFAGADLPTYRDLSHLTGATPRCSKFPHTSELI